ncbi:MAG: phosphoribosyltransferase domain-containing protein, partial [Selenomonadaceae bacterium]|nr:phosphoribosyltransferase domain-containing protein [Selenomonadaceae bacterium]
MRNFLAEDVLRVAKRFKNTRRNYLLVNPLQGKHLPTSPTIALEMMNSLGFLVAEKFSAARLVIGFAETATAVGALVAKNISDDCFYLHTTREN